MRPDMMPDELAEAHPEPAPENDYSRWVEFCSLTAAAADAEAEGFELYARAAACDPCITNREHTAEHNRKMAKSCRARAADYRRMAAEHGRQS